MKSHGCQFCEDGDRRPASRIWSRSAAGIGRSVNDRTLRREVIASKVCMTLPTPATPGFILACAGATGRCRWGESQDRHQVLAHGGVAQAAEVKACGHA